MREAEQAGAEGGKDRAPERPVKRERVWMGQAGSPDGRVRVRRHGQEHERLECGKEAADGQPVLGNPDEIVMMGGAEEPRDERQAHDDVEPLLHDLAIDAGESDEEVREERPLDHLPDPFDPQVNGPPAVEDGHRVVPELEQRGQVEQRRHHEARHQNAFGRGQAFRCPNRHAEVVQKHQHDDHDRQFHRQRLFEQFVAGRPVEEVADDRRQPADRPQRERRVCELRTVQLRAGLFRHDPIRGPHETREHPDDQ